MWFIQARLVYDHFLPYVNVLEAACGLIIPSVHTAESAQLHMAGE